MRLEELGIPYACTREDLGIPHACTREDLGACAWSLLDQFLCSSTLSIFAIINCCLGDNSMLIHS